MLSFVSITELATGERIGFGAVEITTIPHLSILQKRFSAIANIDTEYKQDMARLLSEVFQNYKNISAGCQDISLEILWSTQEVKNQPFKASITLHIIIRAIGNKDAEIENTITSLMRICKATLDFGKYDYRDATVDELVSRVHNINNHSVKAVVKSERLEILQNNLMPYCFAFDKIPVTENDLSRLVNSLIDYPDCAVSFQLIPVSYSVEESSAVDGNAQMLDTLSKGVMDQGNGNVSFALAEKHAKTYKYYSQNKNSALFAFNVLVYGTPSATNAIASRILAQLNNSSELRLVSLSPSDVRKDDNFYPLPWAVHEVILGTDRNPSVWNVGQHLNAFYSLPYVITAAESSEFFRLPIGSETVFAGLVVNESVKASRTYADNVVGGGDIVVGELKSSSHGDNIGISLKDLTKHMLIVGTPGSGKTTFSVSLLDRLWKEHQIPFLVIEPAKNEYRALVQSIPDIQVFTPGKNFISPFIFNPFVPPKNVRLESYKSTLKTAFAAAVTMSSPLDKIFEETVNNCYSDFRWLDTYTSDDKGRIFNIMDFIKCFLETFDNIGYTGEVKNLGRAGYVRLNSLVNLFDNYHSIPIEHLLSKPTIIELAAIENSDQKALIIALLLLSILAYVNRNYIGEGHLRNVILLEEAHVLLDSHSNAGEAEADPAAIAKSLVKRMLAEIRSYGVGVVIADQSPRKVSLDVVGLTNIKLAFRLVETSDKEIIANSTNMIDVHIQRLSRLKPGEAFLFYDKLDDPEEVKTEEYRLNNDIAITISDEEIMSLSTYWSDKKELLKPYPECYLLKTCTETCDFALRNLAKELSRRIFGKNFKADTSDFNVLKAVYGKIERSTLEELNDEPFNKKLASCVKMQFLRRVKYYTRIKLTDKIITETLKKLN